MAVLSFTTYFDVISRKFRIQDTSLYASQGIDVANVKGIIKLTSPRGVTYNTTSYLTPDVTPATSLYSGWIALPTNAAGYVLAGAYTVQYSIQDSGNGNAISTQSNSYTYSFIVPEIIITQTPDGYNSTFESKDDTVYGSYTSLVRTHTVTPPSGSPLSVTSNSNAIIDYAADIWSGEWTSTITSVLVYTQLDNLVINCTITDTQLITAYNIDMDTIRGYIDTLRVRYYTALGNDRDLAYRLNSKLLQIDTAYAEYDLALYYNDLPTAYLRAVDIITQLSDIIPVTPSEEVIPFVNHGGGSTHNPVTINPTYAYGATITASQVLSLALATAAHGGMIPQLPGSSTYYFGGDGAFHVLTGGGDVLKTDFTAFDNVRAITATDILHWTTAYGWGNHASAGYALLTNVYTKTNLQTSGQAAVHWGNITNTPTTLSGYGITNGVIGNVAITGATHTKITYDSKGLVTGGSDITNSDIPNLDWSKITTGLPTTLAGYGITNAYTKTETVNLTWAWGSITGTPTTIAGYGITNAYTKTEVNALTWPWTSITATPTTLAGYGITNALSTSSPAANVISSGVGNKFLADDATYKFINFSGVTDKQVVFINGSTPAGDDFFLFDNITNTLYVSNVVGDIVQVESSIDFIGSDSHSGSSSGFRKWGDVRIRQSNGNLIFKDHYYRKTLSELVSGSTNFWTQNGSDIYFGTGTNKVGINQANPTAELDVVGHIVADNFDSNYFRYKNSNILIGPNAGDNETSNNLLYISNSNTTTPLIYGDFANQEIIFNADVYIDQIKRLAFTDSTVSIRRDSLGNLEFRDLNANSGNPITLTTLSTLSSGYALKSDFISYASVNSITAANLVTWGKASILTTAGAGTKFLTDNGTYQVGGGGGVTPMDYTFKFDGVGVYYRPYLTKTEAGGAASSGKFYNGTSATSATNRLNYDGNLYATNLNAQTLTSTVAIGTSPLTVTSTSLVTNLNSDLLDGQQDNYYLDYGNFSNIPIYNFINSPNDIGGILFADPLNGGFPGDDINYFSWNVTNKRLSVNYGTSATASIHIGAGTGLAGSAPLKFTAGTNLSGVEAGAVEWDGTNLFITQTGLTRKTIAYTTDIVTPVDDILDWSTNKYTPYAAQTTGAFDRSVTNPTHTTRLNYDGILYQYGVRIGDNDYGSNFGSFNPNIYSSSSYAAMFFVTNDNVVSLFNTGVINQDNSNAVLNLRRQTSGNFNITGAVINITDNPSGSGNRNYSTLQATIGSTVRIDMNPRVVDGASAIVYMFDTNSALSTSGAKLASWKNNGVEKSYIGYDGIIYSATGYRIVSGGTFGTASNNGLIVNASSLQFGVSGIVATLNGTGLGLSIAFPTVQIHQDQGNGVATYHKFTAGTTTGTTINDGFNIGIDGTGKAWIAQLENLNLGFKTNNVEVFTITNAGVFNIGNITGGNYSTFEADGTLRFNGAATVFDDIQPSSVTIGSGATAPAFTTYNGALAAYEFVGTGGTVHQLNMGFQLPHSYKEGSDIVPHIHLFIPDNVTGGTIKFYMEYTWTNLEQTGAVSPTTISGTLTRTASEGINNNSVLSFGTVSGAGMTISSMFMCRIYRDPGDVADTFGASVWLKSSDIHVEKDTIGSRTISSK
jgi:hypothetical protein